MLLRFHRDPAVTVQALYEALHHLSVDFVNPRHTMPTVFHCDFLSRNLESPSSEEVLTLTTSKLISCYLRSFQITRSMKNNNSGSLNI